MTPCAIGCTRSPASLSAPANVSTNSCARSTSASSHSRISGVNAPTRSTCVPSRTHAPRTTGSRAVVAHETMSASASATVRSGAGSAGRWWDRSNAAVRVARSNERPQTLIRSIGRTAQWAAATYGASAPVPTTTTCFESARERYVDARAEAAPVRRKVIASPSIKATGWPVVPSISRYSAATLGRPRSRLRGNTVTIFTPSPAPSHAGISNRRSPSGVTGWLARTGAVAPARNASRSASTSDG